ncbi:hypothetical protein OF83DRAFT_638135 [Amylostereum chailletii]|nr:hypothetical protein OF83DRAFT_638135 [Amylostereum chailletii]
MPSFAQSTFRRRAPIDISSSRPLTRKYRRVDAAQAGQTAAGWCSKTPTSMPWLTIGSCGRTTLFAPRIGLVSSGCSCASGRAGEDAYIAPQDTLLATAPLNLAEASTPCRGWLAGWFPAPGLCSWLWVSFPHSQPISSPRRFPSPRPCTRLGRSPFLDVYMHYVIPPPVRDVTCRRILLLARSLESRKSKREWPRDRDLHGVALFELVVGSSSAFAVR